MDQIPNRWLVIAPLIVPLCLWCRLIGNPFPVINHWLKIWLHGGVNTSGTVDNDTTSSFTIQQSLMAYMLIAVLGYGTTQRLVPHIQQYTLRKNICGKDLGKRGTATADVPIPEALGIVPGAVFLVCLIICLVGYYNSAISTSTTTLADDDSITLNHTELFKLLEINAALLSICFMLFLGFSDDVLDWPWRYKLILPTIASLPLLCCYNGSTTIVMPIQVRSLLWSQSKSTMFGDLLGYFVTIVPYGEGSLVDLGYIYLVYMGMLAVFCTNAINIYAGINGLEAGQSFIIACSILIHNLIEIQNQRLIENHMFSVMTILSFTGVTLGLLQHNWYPAKVFVGDTYCYFAGMTFAVVGILGHFSKTLLLFFIPQIINFLWSVPQLFHIVPCPRHRLPAYNVQTGLMEPSTFPCAPNQYRWLKRRASDTTVPNMTVINLCLELLGPMNERSLCLTLLLLQIVCCTFGFICRYYLAGFFFE